ncbi:hypothetical protein [Pedobacter cryophilus]|uniref:Uncharacterized protein n=1 Tax=Pedobacter cryophilus TaxID=2571271 RepID=A0A4U1C1N5_9SPHI|nr:hypothetical protein [Pedobacter cryophilus]TKB98894.1 hypothetical protein FA046_07200 [Pedobacter cryophilus]
MQKEEDDNMNWEKDAPLLNSIEKSNSFSMPDGYFENLSENIINQISLENLASKSSAFKTPHSYFENFESQLFSKIALEDKKEEFTKNDAGFKTPINYFEISKKQLNTNTKKQKQAKILTLNLIRFAAAACILLTTTLGIYFNVQRTNSINYQLSKVSDEDIETYLKQNTDATDVPLILENLEDQPIFTLDQNQVTDEEIKNYIESTY